MSKDENSIPQLNNEQAAPMNSLANRMNLLNAITNAHLAERMNLLNSITATAQFQQQQHAQNQLMFMSQLLLPTQPQWASNNNQAQNEYAHVSITSTRQGATNSLLVQQHQPGACPICKSATTPQSLRQMLFGL